MKQRRFLYMREDFAPLPVKLLHLDIYIRFYEDQVDATNCLRIRAEEEMEIVELDARDLQIKQVEWRGGSKIDSIRFAPVGYDFLRDKHKLVVRLPRAVKYGEVFQLQTRSTCFPSDHILEGIYRDTTPPGAPQQYMSQCQQWGFQRIMPIFDDCRAKCTMTTTLEGDVRYTHLISNGNIDPCRNPDGEPVAMPGDPGRQVITYINPIPMAPYLFIACAGTWDVLADQVTYPNGKTVRLEYLVPPGCTEQARIPMEILKEAILWIERTQDYQYTGDTYRTICMDKSNFGGMENVGNTTIVTDAALVNEHTLDQQLLYLHAVIVHEFEHNQCGSETTMSTPFDVWLNEAYTVDVERRFMADLFDPTFIRLQQVDSIRNPLLGPLAMEDGGYVGRIVREGFNDPDELIDGVTYVKAAEVIRMLRLILGDEDFKRGKTLYFKRYRHDNADTNQFFSCFEEVSGKSLEKFKQQWLYASGYPTVTATADYDALRQRYRITFKQRTPNQNLPFHIPIQLALVSHDGTDIPGTNRVFELTAREDDCRFEKIDPQPAFLSINRDVSFYGTLRYEKADRTALELQARRDPNLFNRVEAFRQLTDFERIKLLHDPKAPIDPHWLRFYELFLTDGDIPAGVLGYLLRIDEQPLDREYCTWFPELVKAKERLMHEINRKYRGLLAEQLEHMANMQIGTRPGDGIVIRFLKAVLLDLIAIDDSTESQQLIINQYQLAENANDRYMALLALNRSSYPQRDAILDDVYHSWKNHVTGYANYLKIIGSGNQHDIFARIAREQRRDTFDIRHPTLSRALFVSMASNTKMIWSAEGINWIADSVIVLAPVNSTTASRVLNNFQHVNRLKKDLQDLVVKALKRIVGRVSPAVSPTISGQARSYLETASKSP